MHYNSRASFRKRTCPPRGGGTSALSKHNKENSWINGK